jgi:hypothetical protein
MKEIWKFSIITRDRQLVSMPKGAEIVSTQVQNGIICLWAFVDPNAEQEPTYIEVVGTGWQIPSHLSRENYIATVQDGQLVWHVFKVAK